LLKKKKKKKKAVRVRDTSFRAREIKQQKWDLVLSISRTLKPAFACANRPFAYAKHSSRARVLEFYIYPYFASVSRSSSNLAVTLPKFHQKYCSFAVLLTLYTSNSKSIKLFINLHLSPLKPPKNTKNLTFPNGLSSKPIKSR
jgi:hypothetical protein